MRTPFSCFLFGLLLSTTGYAEVNSWAKTTSGNWEEPFWSAGALPSSGSDVIFTNAGWKALALGPSTRAFPDSLTIHNLTVSSPTGSVNTLLFNFLGVLTPFRAVVVQVNSNATLLSLNSRLEISSGMVLDGFVQFGQFSELVTPHLQIGTYTPGEFNMTNGILNVGDQLLMGLYNDAVFNQFGGTNRTTDLDMEGHHTSYRLTGGSYEGVNITVGNAGYDGAEGTFVQEDARVNLSSNLIVGAIDAHGHYAMKNGTLSADREVVGDSGNKGMFALSRATFLQDGGTNTARSLTIGANNYGGTYTLSNGLLRTGFTGVGSRDSIFTHVAGSHIATNGLSLYGLIEGPAQAFFAGYELLSGNLITSQLDLSTAGFNQSGGTNQVSGSVILHAQYYGPSGYGLSGGTLLCSNINIGGGDSMGQVHQTGGTVIISNRLEIGENSIYYEPAAYNLDAGLLQVNTLRIWPYGTFRMTGGSLNSTGVVDLAGGRIEVSAPQVQLGRLEFSRTSYIAFASSPCVLRFANSRDSVLDFRILLVITNWSGSTNGGGYHQIIFGNSPDAWTTGQLGDTVFRNPAGFPPGDYPARILANGEVVPMARPTLALSRAPNSITLSWPYPYTVQTATNILGPYVDLSNASSPYTVQPNQEPQRYFRLRR